MWPRIRLLLNDAWRFSQVPQLPSGNGAHGGRVGVLPLRRHFPPMVWSLAGEERPPVRFFPHLWRLLKMGPESLYARWSLISKVCEVWSRGFLIFFYFFVKLGGRHQKKLKCLAPTSRMGVADQCDSPESLHMKHDNNLNIGHLSFLSFSTLVWKWFWKAERPNNVKSCLSTGVANVHKRV